MTATEDRKWHDEVCKRDSYICCMCGRDYSDGCYFNEEGRNQFVCADHIKTKKAHPELRLVLENGRCIDNECHTLHHKGYTRDEIRAVRNGEPKKVYNQPKEEKQPKTEKTKSFGKIKLTCYYDAKLGKLVKLK